MSTGFSQKAFLPIVFLFFSCLLIHTASAQESIISQMTAAQESLVEISAENFNLSKSPAYGPVLDPQSGRIGVIRNVQQSFYRRTGSGVIIHKSGIIVTNAHTVNRAQQILVKLHNNLEVPAEVIRLVSHIDLALLRVRVPYPLTPVPLADSNKIQLGDDVLTIGNSPLLKQTLSGGKIIGLGRNRTAAQRGETRNDFFQTTFNVYEGDSGGPLFNRQGSLIGLMTAKETGADRSSFAIPANQIFFYLSDYLHGTKQKK